MDFQIQVSKTQNPDIVYTRRWPWKLQITYEFQFSFNKGQSRKSRLNPLSEKALKWDRARTQNKQFFVQPPRIHKPSHFSLILWKVLFQPPTNAGNSVIHDVELMDRDKTRQQPTTNMNMLFHYNW